jgi:hypothetical protein
MSQYKYLVSYNLKTQSGADGFGEAQITTKRKLDTYEAISETREVIKSDNNLQKVIILNIIPLKG